MILSMRERKPFVSVYDLSKRVGLFPFETEYLKDILYFGKKYSLKFRVSYDTTSYFLLDYLYSGHPVVSLWEKRNRIYFMNSVTTRNLTFMQGYVRPVFKGGILENYPYTPGKSGIKRDTFYNFILSTYNFLLFNSPYSLLARIRVKNAELRFLSDSTKRHVKGFAGGIEDKRYMIEGGIKDKKVVFYTSFSKYFDSGKVFWDVYSKYTDTRIYGAHLYARMKLTKNVNLKIYGSYRHSSYTSMRFSLTGQYKIPERRVHMNLGVKKLYSGNARLYLSSGIWGRNYMYFSLTKEIGTPSYMLRYSVGLYNLSFQYILSSGDADYIFLDSEKGTYYMGKIREKFRLKYRLRFKNYTLRMEYETGDINLMRISLYGRFYH